MERLIERCCGLGNLVAEAPKLVEAAAFEPLGAVAIEMVSSELAIGGGFCQQMVGDFEHLAAGLRFVVSMVRLIGSCGRRDRRLPPRRGLPSRRKTSAIGY